MTPGSHRPGRPRGVKNKHHTKRLPPLRLTLDLDDPRQAQVSRILLEAYQRRHGEYTGTALQMLLNGVAQVIPDDRPLPQTANPSFADALSSLVDWGDDEY